MDPYGTRAQPAPDVGPEILVAYSGVVSRQGGGGRSLPRVGENVKVKCPNRHCGRETWVKWGYSSNCEYCKTPIVTGD